MKKIISLTILLVCAISNAQTVGFKNNSQKVELSEKTITLEIIIQNNTPQKKGTMFELELSHNVEGKGVFPNLDDGKKSISIDPNNYHGAYSVKIDWNTEKVKDINNIVFQLKKKSNKQDLFTIDHNFHIINPFKKTVPTISFGILNSCCQEISPTFINDSQIELQFALITDKSGITKEDQQKITVGFVGVNGFNTTYELTYNPASPLGKVQVKKEEGNEDFNTLKEYILKNKKIELEIKEVHENKKFKVQIDDKKKKASYTYNYNALENKYDIFIGSNFDIQEEFSTSKFFAEINVFLPDLVNDKYGLRGGIYKNNTSTKLEQDRREETVLSIVENTTDSISFTTKRVSSTPSVSIENLGIFVEGLYALKKTDNFNMFLGFHVEVIQRVEQYTFESDDLITLGSSTISLDSLSTNTRLIGLLSRPNSFTNKYVDSYFGVSLPTFYHHRGKGGKDLEVMINPSIGLGEPGIPLNPRENNSISFYGFTQFHLIFGSEKGLRFKIGGEARKYFDFDQAPIITVNLSAAINLEELFKTGG